MISYTVLHTKKDLDHWVEERKDHDPYFDPDIGELPRVVFWTEIFETIPDTLYDDYTLADMEGIVAELKVGEPDAQPDNGSQEVGETTAS